MFALGRRGRGRSKSISSSRGFHRASQAGLLVFVWVVASTSFVDLRVPESQLDYGRLTSTRFFAADGTLLFERPSSAGGYGAPVPLSQVSPFVVQATLAGEDANFHRHPGIDPVAVVRALWLNAREGKFAYGGSTLTQQLAKRIAPEPRNLPGKLREALFALRLEHSLTKGEILAQYLNRAYYGRNATGIEAASRRYFGKSASELDLAEATLLAALPRAPTAYDPDRFPARLRARRSHLLDLMLARGFIDGAQAKAARSRSIELAPRTKPLRARHAVDRLMQEVSATGDVVTSLDLELQTRLDRLLERHLSSIQRYGAEQAAVLVVKNDDVRIVAMVGSRNYDDAARHGAVNGATSRRSAGSTLKPFLYAMAFERGETPSSPILDRPTTWPGYLPRNHDDQPQGWVTLERALGSSLNVPAVALLERTGVRDFAQRLSELGFSRVDPSGAKHGLSLALGAVPVSLVELASAYSSFANGGMVQTASLVDGERVELRAFDRTAAETVTRVLSNPRARQPEFGLETPLDLPFAVAAKTGTSSAYCDNWTVGYTKEVTVAVWVGNFDGRPLRGALAMEGAAPLFSDAMFEAMRERVPARMVGTEGDTREPVTAIATASAGLAFESPREGARLVVDPLLPAATQRIVVRVEPHPLLERAALVEYRLNQGEWVAFSPSRSLSLPLVAGRHSVAARAHDAAGSLIAIAADVHFTVTHSHQEQIHD
jgi:penicillin-binding protein 1C